MGSERLLGTMGLLLLGAVLLCVAPADGAIGALTASPQLRRTPSFGLRGGVATRLVLRGGMEEDGEEEEEEEESDGVMTVSKALKEVLYFANTHDGCLRGIKEVLQALERGEAQLVVLAEDCDNKEYVELVEALCADKGVYLMRVPEKKILGEWAGLVKLDMEDKVKKVCAASSCCVRDFGVQSEGLKFLLAHIKAETGGAPDEPEATAEGEEEEG
ncbi:50S ribosomal protein L30e-like protein, partial [Baffinella frigidus]